MTDVFELKEYSELKKISAGVPNSNISATVLYLLCTRDLSIGEGAISTFTHDTAVLATGKKIEEAVAKTPKSCNQIDQKMTHWIK